MIELSVRFTSDEQDEHSPILVSLFRPDTGTATGPAPFQPPLDDAQLADLRWYLEVFASWPTGPDYERAERIQASLEEWGRALLKSVIGGDEAPRLWQQFADAEASGKLLTVDATDPRVLRLPWELLADEGGHLFAQGVGVRRRLQQTTAAPLKPFALPVRVLVVVSRPDDAPFIDPRAVSKPLLDALDGLGERAAVEFLYPPTLKTLTARLRERAAPPVHVVHFDGHGIYDARLGLGYLLFEDDTHRADRVDAHRLGTLLNRCGVPLMALNACQSAAQQEANPYASVAARLIRAGVGSVLAMNYSVLVVAAEKFVAAFYGGLAGGLPVGRAVDEGRYALLADEQRHTLTRRNAKGELVEETVRLRDWFLPALYQQAADPTIFPLSPASGERGPGGVKVRPRALTDPHFPGGLPPAPRHRFHGRAREMLRLERELAGHAVVVLYGFGGIGKTALAAEAGRWFARTGRFPGGAAFVSFEHGGSLAQLCSWVGQAVSDDPNFVLGEGDPVARVVALLRERPALVLLDNFEAVLGRAPLMPPEEVRAVLDAVWQWSGGAGEMGSGGAEGPGSRVLITTRDTAFQDVRFGPSQACAQIELGGLAQDDALALAAAVLDDCGIDRTRVERQALVDLMERLGGHPLSLYLVLPHLGEHTPDQLSARFEQLLPGFTTGAARERNESLALSLEFSLQRLGDETRAALPDLAVFQGGAMEGDLLEITQIDAELWRAARAEMEQAALVTAESLPNVTVPFLRFHPTLRPYLAARLPAARRAALEARYWKRYYATANYLYRSDTQHPLEARAIVLRELPNLRRALDLAIAAGEVAAAVDFADSIVMFLNNFGRWREREALLKKVAGLQVGGAEGLTKAEYLLLSQQGNILLQQGQAAEAEQVFRRLLARMEAGAAYDAAYDHAMMILRLGRCLAAQGWPAQAVEFHRRALGEFEHISESSESAKRMIGTVHTDLADLHAALGKFADAENEYKSALAIDEELGDDRGRGVDLGQLGNLALRRGDLAEAGQRYAEALETFRALGEPQAEAVVWHQLGMVAGKARAWEEAERCYREAVRIREQIRDLPGLAQSFNQLAIVAQGAGRPADAERWYLLALAAFEQLKDPAAQAKVLNNLADLYLSQGRLDEAARYARRAVEIKETLDLSAEPWTTYSILAEIAQAQEHPDEAATWRCKEQESFAAYPGAVHEIREWTPVIQAVVAACEGDVQAAEHANTLLQQLEEGWPTTVASVRRILTGERDIEVLREGLSCRAYVVIHTILAQLAGGALTPNPSPNAGRGEEDLSPAPSPNSGGGEEALTPTPSPNTGGGEEEAVARVRQQWAALVQAVVAACRGNQQAATELAPFLEQLSAQDDWRALAGVLGRIIAGERDPHALLPGLDATDTLIASDVLRALGALTPGPSPDAGGGEEEGAVTLDQFLASVVLACTLQAPPGLAEQLYGTTREMATRRDAPPEIRALGRALNAVLSGERDPDLSALPPALAEKVRKVLAQLK